MEKFLSFDRATIIRAVPLGLLFVGILTFLLKFDLIEIDSSWEVNLANVILCVILGLVLDFFGLYKMHPAYIVIRRNFFLRIYAISDINEENLSASDRIQRAEHVREDVLYSQYEKRLSDLRVEHAIWILMYNISIILFFTLIAMLYFISSKKLNIYDFQLVLVLFLALSIGASWSAIKRNQSYGEKIAFLTNKWMQK